MSTVHDGLLVGLTMAMRDFEESWDRFFRKYEILISLLQRPLSVVFGILTQLFARLLLQTMYDVNKWSDWLNSLYQHLH